MDWCSEVQHPTVDDKQIIQLYWEREERAILETDYKYGSFLLRVANNILNDKADSEECRNDTYLGIWYSIPPNRPAVFPAFITKIMRNIAINKYKEKTRQKRIPSEMILSIESLHNTLPAEDILPSDYSTMELAGIINEYLSRLTSRQKYIFVGRFYMGDKPEVIARELHVNVSTIYRAIDKIRKGLKVHLERKGIYV